MDRLTIENPDGSKIHVDTKSTAVKEVRQTGPNTFEVTIDKKEAKETRITIED